ncbi:hypothetical protein ZIOFF_075407 [Zingiber officinale]|uniref:Kinesin-like protein n=1 Tax=Zingiber officinale TaxID=94328 RepID=A0A8J5BTT8_ZINOF|nr:hypothetical protein ZIOFF_075407 [Zingiber officinale]
MTKIEVYNDFLFKKKNRTQELLICKGDFELEKILTVHHLSFSNGPHERNSNFETAIKANAPVSTSRYLKTLPAQPSSRRLSLDRHSAIIPDPMEEAPISPPSPRSPVQEDAPMAPGEASAQEEKENTKQESIDNIVQAIRDECLVPSPILKGVPLPDVPSALLLIGRKYNTLTEANQGLREECEHLRKKCAEECEPKYDILKKKYTDEREERKRLYNEVIELKGNIRVYCRCRPLSLEEIAKGSSCVVDFDPAHDTELRIICTDSSKKQFKFDHIFGHKDDQDAVFKETLPIVKSVLDGFNVCIFAYGQTGSGKTFTMEGIPENRGVNYRALDELFKISGQRSSLMRYEFYVSMLEVYNEKIRDLLADSPDQLSKRLDIKQASDGTQDVPGLLEPQVGSIDEVWEILTNGGRNRSVGSTNANELSSRSHSLVRVTIKGESFVDGQKFTSRLWLVDLAGSERLGKIEVEGERLKESQFINKSLSALGDVISALASKNPHIPYRNSKLTHLLQSSLGGDCKTLMFAQISPSSADLGETLCSLNFASRVRGIEHGPVRKQTDFAESFKLKQMADKLLQSEKENIRLNESLQLMQLKYASRENVFKTLQDKFSHLMIPKRRSLASFTPIRGSLGAATTPDKSNFSTLASSSKYRSPSRFQAFSKSMIPTFSSPHQRLRLTSSPTNAEHLDGAHQTTNKLCFSVQKRVIVSSPARPKQFMHQGHTMFNQVLRGGNLVGRLQGTAQRVLCKNKRRSVI